MFVRRNASRLAALTVPLVLAAGSLAGCSDGEADPGPAPSTSASSPSPSKSSPSEPLEPTLPAEAQGDDAEAAKAFVRHYYDYVNYAQATGDTKGLRHLGLGSCVACDSSAEWIEQVRDNGGEIRGGNYQVKDLRVSRVETVKGAPQLFEVTANLTNTKQVVEGAGQKLNETYPSGPSRWRLLVVRDSEAWRISRWDVQ